MKLREQANRVVSRLSFAAMLGLFVFKGDACICGGSHAPPPPQPSPTAPSAATPPPPPPPG